MRSRKLLAKQRGKRHSLMLRSFTHMFVESSQPMLHYISPDKSWSSDWTGYYVTRWVQKLGMDAQMAATPPRVRGDIFHYADAQSLLNNLESRSNDNNWLVTTVSHGDKDDEQSDIGAIMELSEDLNGLVVTTETMLDRFAEWGVREDKLVYIPYGVDLNNFFPASAEEQKELREKYEIPDGAFVVGSFQKDGLGWDEGEEPSMDKGPDIFLEVIEALKSEIPSLHVLLTGPARGYVKAGLDRIGVSYGHFHLKDYAEIRDCYACLNTYLSTGREGGGPKAILESMACGAPVVSTRMGLAKDIIEHGENGLIADVDDVEALTDLVSSLHENAELCSTLSVAGLEVAREFDWSVIAGLYFEHVYAPLMVQRYS